MRVRLLGMLDAVVGCTQGVPHPAILRDRAALIHQMGERTVSEPADRAEVTEAFERVEWVLDPRPLAPRWASRG